MHVQSKSQIPEAGKSVDTLIVPAKQLFVDFHSVDALLRELKSSKENGVDDAGSRHGDAESWRQSVNVVRSNYSLQSYLDTSAG